MRKATTLSCWLVCFGAILLPSIVRNGVSSRDFITFGFIGFMGVIAFFAETRLKRSARYYVRLGVVSLAIGSVTALAPAMSGGDFVAGAIFWIGVTILGFTGVFLFERIDRTTEKANG